MPNFNGGQHHALRHSYFDIVSAIAAANAPSDFQKIVFKKNINFLISIEDYANDGQLTRILKLFEDEENRKVLRL